MIQAIVIAIAVSVASTLVALWRNLGQASIAPNGETSKPESDRLESLNPEPELADTGSAWVFTTKEAAAYSDASVHQIRYWSKVGVLAPQRDHTSRSHNWSFSEVVLASLVRRLLDHGLTLQRLRTAWDYLRDTAELQEGMDHVLLPPPITELQQRRNNVEQMRELVIGYELEIMKAIESSANQVEEAIASYERDRERFIQMLEKSNAPGDAPTFVADRHAFVAILTESKTELEGLAS